ncbi:hypothetical protein J2W97_000806 [Paenibacillus jamilae]|jgi:hypothetical protein|uniref:hypothetical protein n=1 Tax=Paenibacillus polymyxa TaxID=1406 RepID=UPI0015805DBD|nr:hypothetical protein [Paenibacillus polymyxa]MDP9674823.1 hypothetical protein [Paenibacillus jamilae]MBY0023808.1 hypothetical protein [Paenibacillus polymyxa]MBY0056480.1 hypothetical protein [Paenibacillus polymyxa]MBY0071827.1 hypothetical protein [Paenibacillus polymyxa]MBY0080607.1 hypothetical protein [Paenibacillus polymyxa]
MRDLTADLAVCEAATEGATMCTGDSEVFCEYIDDRLPDSLIGRFARTEDALFFAEAREGWPEAIRRAIASERENAELRDWLMGVFQKARNDVARWDGGQCVGLPVFQDRSYARRLVKDLQPILFPYQNK